MKSLKSKWRAFRWWWWRKIAVPIGNWLVDIKKRSVVINYEGHYYEAEYHRLQFFYDFEPINLCTILKHRKKWIVTYWDRFERLGHRGCEMLSNCQRFVYGRDPDLVRMKVELALTKAIASWVKDTGKESKDDQASNSVTE